MVELLPQHLSRVPQSTYSANSPYSSGIEDRDRTCDLSIISRMFYQLNYPDICVDEISFRPQADEGRTPSLRLANPLTATSKTAANSSNPESQ